MEKVVDNVLGSRRWCHGRRLRPAVAPSSGRAW